jgi:hypothetical protein
MKKISIGLLFLTSLIACTTPQPSSKATPLTQLNLILDGSPLAAGKVRSQTALNDNIISNLTTTYSGMIDSPLGERWIFNTFEFDNQSGATLSNLTFYGLAKPSNIGGTALYRMEYSNGTSITDPSIARSLKPSHGFTSNGVTLDVSSAAANLQAISVFDAVNRESSARNNGIITTADTVLEYGFVAHNAVTGSRTIQTGQKGRFTVAAKITMKSPFTTPSRLTFTFLLFTEQQTSVTKTPDESIASVQARATALGTSVFNEITTSTAQLPNGQVLNPKISTEDINYINTKSFPSNAIIAARTNSQPNGQALAITIEAIDPSGNLLWSKEIRTNKVGGHFALTTSGLNPEEGLLSRSTNGKCVTITGISSSVGSFSVNSSSSTTNPRVIGIISSDGAINTRTTAGTAYNGSVIGGAASSNCTSFYTAGGDSSQSLRNQFLNNSTSLAVAGDGARTIAVKIANNQLFTTMTNSPTHRLGRIGFLPTAGILPLEALGIPTTQYLTDFDFVDITSSIAGMDTFYAIVDDNKITKYSSVSGNWIESGSLSGFGNIKTLTTKATNGNVDIIFAVGNELKKVTDTSGYNATITGTVTTLRTGQAGVYLGLALAPQP